VKREQPRRAVPSFLISAVLHIVLGAGLLRLIAMPNGLAALFSDWGTPVRVERIGFIALPRSLQPTVQARDGGDNRPDRGKPSVEPPAPTLVSPVETPSAPLVVPAQPSVPAAEGGSGEVIGSGGPTKGIRPSYNDPRLWIPSGPVVTAPAQPRTRAESLQNTLAERIRQFNDSVAVANGHPRAPGDWTYTTKSGDKYGIDQKYIRLGKFSIPTAVLGMMPLNITANPIQLERQRAMSQMSSEIQYQAARVARDGEFRAAVKALRLRKDRERRDAEEKAKADASTSDKPIKP
jgi:hypothetical protein